jgi:SAM-dependent methyltransferase
VSDLNDPLYRDPSLVEFYDIENSGRDDFDYCLKMAESATSVLDLGCGTGQLIAEVAGGRRLAGVDPAGAMLDIARTRKGGETVRWVEADAQSVRLGETFDLVLLTGHAFQVFLTDDDALAVLRTIAAHLAPQSRFIFDMRNPVREEWREWTPEGSTRMIAHPAYGPVKAWNDVRFDRETAIATYQTFYEIPAVGKTLSAASQIRFTGKDRLSQLIAEAGLKTDQWLGDWKGQDYRDDSKEIIPIGRLA